MTNGMIRLDLDYINDRCEWEGDCLVWQPTSRCSDLNRGKITRLLGYYPDGRQYRIHYMPHRATYSLVYDLDYHGDWWIKNLCGDHLCCNVDHYEYREDNKYRL